MSELKNRLEALKQKLDPKALEQQAKEIEDQSTRPGFWQDHQKASRAMKKMAGLQREVKDLENLEDLLREGREKELDKKLKEIETRTFLSGRHDRSDVIFSIHAGQGGVEAMDWAQMLQRMYTRFFEKKDWQFQINDLVPGEEAGVKSLMMTVRNSFVYGYLKHEAGTHRLVRQSPFNADNLRQTSFALVEVLPILDEVVVDLRDEDIHLQTFRSSGPGGQYVNKVATAVRLKHQPTGLVVTCQSQRRQEQNRKIAKQILAAKLWEIQEKERKEVERKLKGGKTKAAWGTQIRSYVLHPYKLVKDLRTGHQTGKVEDILDGELDGFVEAELRHLS